MLRASGPAVSAALAPFLLASCLLTIDEGLIDGGGGSAGTVATGGNGGEPAGGGGDGGEGAQGGSEPAGQARLLYSDLEGGPNDGGENDDGAFVTLYGRGFGSSQGTSFVTFGDGVAPSCPVWSDTKLTCQLGSEATTGEVVVHVDDDGYSNGLVFTVRPGAIYFVGPLGDDNGDGLTPGEPFETIPHCLAELAPGGICYALDVVQQLDTDGAALVLPPSSQELGPKALIAYPGATPRIESAATRGVLACNDTLGCSDDGRWVLGGLRIEAPARALDAPEIVGLRLVGSTIFCASASEAGDCLSIADGARDIALLGNVISVTEIPAAGTSAAIDVGAVTEVDIGWNAISGPAAWRGIRVDGAGDLAIHDNQVTHIGFRGVELFVDLEAGPARLENNVIAFVGDGTDTSGCIAYNGAATVGPLELAHNTLYACGSPAGANLYDNGSGIVATNNAFAQPDGAAFYKRSGFGTAMQGKNNLFSGSATVPTLTEDNVIGSPSFVAPALDDFHLLAGSDCIDAGALDAGVELDRDGRLRDAAPDIGAYERER